MAGELLLGILGLGFGLFTAGAVFTTVIVVGLVPRFAGRFHTARKVFLYEEWVIAGSLAGGVYGVFTRIGKLLHGRNAVYYFRYYP